MGILDFLKKKTSQLADKKTADGRAANIPRVTSRFQEALIEAVDREQDPTRRAALINEITDQAVLFELVKNGTYETDRTRALGRLTHQELLMDTALHNTVLKVRSLAVRKLDDVHSAALVRQKGLSEGMQRTAVSQIKSADILRELANDTSLEYPVKNQAAYTLGLRDPSARKTPTGKGTQGKREKPAAATGKKTILDKYREGLAYLNSCGPFDESKFREFNRLTGNRFSEQDQQIRAMIALGGTEELRSTLRSTMTEAIAAFEKLEQQGIDLTKYDP